MGLDAHEIEGIARGIYGEAREDVDDPPGTVTLARRILGQDAVRPAFIDNMVGDAMLVREWDRWIIVVRRRLTFERLNWVVGHELGEWALRREGYEEDDRETIANGVAGALAMPQTIFARMFRANGFDLSWMAAEFIVPEGAVALRVGEVVGEPVALVTPKRIHRRDERNELPANDDLRRLSRQTLDAWHPVTAVRCRDAANTYAFRLSA